MTVFVVALLGALFTTPILIWLAPKVGAIDMPGPRRVNTKPVIRMGGPAMFIGVVLGIAVAHRHIPEWVPLMLCAAIVLVVGIIDDIHSLGPFVKLAGQIGAAALAFKFGVRIEFMSNPISGGLIIFPEWLSFCLTIAWLVGITNAINLIDGLDGLAAGIVSIASMTFFLVAVSRGQAKSALLAAAMVGATGGFLRWNFYPAKIIMGDSGAYFLGFTSAMIAVYGAFKSTTALTLLIPIFALGLPIFDTGFAIARRVFNKMPVMSAPDKGHVHHRLLALGWRHRESVIFCYLATLFLSSVALAIVREWLLALYLFISISAFTLLLIGAGKVVKRRKKGLPQ